MDGATETQPSEPNLMYVSHSGNRLVADTTKYLSTLPHPIEVIEELVAVCSVTSSLLINLNSAVLRFHNTRNLCPKASFINPLCTDILSGFNAFSQKVEEAKKLKVFEPNDVGLVRVPRNAWVFVVGGEAKMGQLRSRLYVEKYRVRVLIDTVAWMGLRSLRRNGDEERELQLLVRMLPLVADRLVGVWRDYKLRIGNGSESAKVDKQELAEVVRQQRPVPVAAMQQAPSKQQEGLKKEVKMSSKLSIHSCSSTSSVDSSCSTSSSVTVLDDSIYERWVLRLTPSTRVPVTQSRLFGVVPLKTTYKITPANFYVKPMSSHPTDIDLSLSKSRSDRTSITSRILSLSDDAQWETQKLLESRQNVSSGPNIQRSWDIIGFHEQPRRKIHTSANQLWWKRSSTKKMPVEWVIILKGETLDHKTRTMPVKHQDPWNPPKPKPAPQPQQQRPVICAPQSQPARLQQPPLQQTRPPMAPGSHVLRHVEQKRGLSIAEAESKMMEIVGDLMKFENEGNDVTHDNGRERLDK